MNHKVAMMEVEVNKLTRQLALAKSDLEQVRRTCRHQWGKTQYTPDIQEAYTIPADPPGTMGVDWRPECHVPRQVTPKWTRTCEECGLKEETQQTEDKIEKILVFRR